MKIKVVSVNAGDIVPAVKEIKARLLAFSPEYPNFLMIYFSAPEDAEELCTTFMQNFPGTVIAGIPARYGSFGESLSVGFENGDSQKNGNGAASAGSAKSRFSVKKFSTVTSREKPLFVQAFYDPTSAFGCAAREFKSRSPMNLDATLHEIENSADRAGIMPNLMMLFNTKKVTSAFGSEIKHILGNSASIVGGILDNEHGPVTFFTNNGVVRSEEAYLIVSLYTNTTMQINSLSEVKLFGELGKISSTDDITINEIDDKPAADMFFTSINIDSTCMDTEELQRLLSGVNRDYFLAYDSYDVEYGNHYNVSVVNSVTENRGVVLNSAFPQGEKVYLMKAHNHDMANCFMIHYPPDCRPVGIIHFMCESFCKGSKTQNFNNIIERVRNYNSGEEFMTCSVAGENIGTIDEEYRLANCTVITVSFLEHVG